VALILAVLYFGFIELLMMDASREMSEARRFRNRIVALTLAESAAELAAMQMVSGKAANVELQDAQGSATGELKKTGAPPGEIQFELFGKARSSGPEPSNATVHIEGVIKEGTTQLRILFARHSQ
jgi:hypothetical protein